MEDQLGLTARLQGAQIGTVNIAVGSRPAGAAKVRLFDAKGTLVYSGAIDDSSDRGETAGKTNYVINALTQLKAGQAVSPGTTKAYGCSVKYRKG